MLDSISSLKFAYVVLLHIVIVAYELLFTHMSIEFKEGSVNVDIDTSGIICNFKLTVQILKGHSNSDA